MPKKINWASKLKTYCFAKVDKEMFLLASLDLEVDKKNTFELHLQELSIVFKHGSFDRYLYGS